MRCAICEQLLARVTDHGALEIVQRHHGERHVISWSLEQVESLTKMMKEAAGGS